MRSIIWHETSYQDKEYKSPIEGTNILEFEIIRTKGEFYQFSDSTAHIHKYIKIRTSSLNLIIGDTGVGKTTFATHLASLNSEKNYKQLYISLEMECGEIFRKCFVFNEVYGSRKKKNLTIIEERCCLDLIIESIRNHKNSDDELKIVYIDHLHLINVITDIKNMIPMDKIANDLLELSRELKIAIIGICQLTRESTKMFSAPQLHDIKNSSNLENNASIILSIHNPYLNTLRAARARSIDDLPFEKRMKVSGKENLFVLSVLKNRHERLIDPIEYIKVEVINEEKNTIEQQALFLFNE
jgi:replicative DNA helicase